jgi:hypothetical protein
MLIARDLNVFTRRSSFPESFKALRSLKEGRRKGRGGFVRAASERVSDPPGLPVRHVTSMPNAEQLPVSSEAGAVSWEQPKFGLSDGLSSPRSSNPAVKQAHGEAEPVHREDGRQLTRARKT